jgi:hypothetical protein
MPSISSNTRTAIIEENILLNYSETVAAFYFSLIEAGKSPVLAEMLATRRAPTAGMASDRQFNSSYRRSMSGLSQEHRDAIQRIAARAGISTEGKYYVSGIGRYDDPLAWVSTNDDVRAACKAKGHSAHGPGIDYECEAAEPVKKPLHESIASRFEQKLLQDPKVAEKVKRGGTKARRELRERVEATHGRRAP